jgi:hypothetical protein
VIRLSDDAPTGRGHQGQIESSQYSAGLRINQLLASITAYGAIVCGTWRKARLNRAVPDEADSKQTSPTK